MTELQHMMVGMIISTIFYYIFLRKYALKQYHEIKSLKKKNKIPVGSNRPDIMNYDEFMEKKDNLEIKNN